ncbi:FtsW/RodA/SpoVE family cell cycle protein [Paenibacillus tengchongensis]|uniref:FtsW/RodA/SpoVE family cell cycle protein n=1 Tax=Paenibacillus tengchongensis TaxID=2608684 RepID=UPI00124EB73E|nr:FtsW/RodA/SpoVE family cell cycle protein [Paenibacillus tengchongensis]
MLQKIRKIDGVLVVVLLLLMCVSILSIYSVTHGREKQDGMHLKMLVFYGLGFAVFLVTALFNYRLLVKYAPYFYLLGLGILLFVSFFGKTINGAKGWIVISGVSLQPAELFKLLLILFLAYILVRKNRETLRFWRDCVPLGLAALLPFAIVILQNDLGNALSYLVILIGLLWVGRMRFAHALIGFLIFGGMALAFILSYINYHDATVNFIKNTLGRDHFIARFDTWLVPEQASSDDSYQVRNAKMAIASGGMSGEGYLEGSTVQSNRVPYMYSDSIFVAVAEEFGFLGAALLLLLFFILIHRLVLIALASRDRAGPFLIIGITAMLLYQILENIGAYIGLMPLTGITLPFISFGGTSLIINMACMGIAMSVLLYGQEEEEELPVLPAVPAMFNGSRSTRG